MLYLCSSVITCDRWTYSCRLRSWIRWCLMDFFFFKQKTAYEMRISDWSSDVCSSDLVVDPFPMLSRAFEQQFAVLEPGIVDEQPGRAVEIGRASCRERVCQYV